jgi:serine/threonine protein kinase
MNPLPANEPSAIDVLDGLSQTTPLNTPSPRNTKSASVGDTVIFSPNSATRYEIQRVLGSGAFGTVSLAWDTTLQRDVAIKKPASTANNAAKQTFLVEAQLAARIKHPNVVIVHNYGIDDNGDPFVLYEYLKGPNLRDRIAAGPIELREALQLSITIADALAAVHNVGLTHRDLKPANIVLEETEGPHIVDFGLAVSAEMQADQEEGEQAGTYRYMAPEQIRGDAKLIDGRTDLWALGVIMFQMLTGKYPFPANKKQQIFDQVLNSQPLPPRRLNPAVPQRLENIILKLLAKSPDDRYASAKDLVVDLQTCLATLDEPRPATPRPWPPLWVSSVAGTGLTLVAAAVLILLAIYPGQENNPKTESHPNIHLQPAALGSSLVENVWTSVLRQEPQVMIRHGEDLVMYSPGEVAIDAEYQVVLRLGEMSAPSYSYRVTVEPDSWNAKAGLFIGWRPAIDPPNADVSAFFGVRQMRDQLTLLPRRVYFQSGGTQLPIGLMDLTKFNTIPLIPAEKAAEIHVEVENGEVAQLFLNSQRLRPVSENRMAIPTQGIFGVYVLGGKCKFTKAEVRITKKE